MAGDDLIKTKVQKFSVTVAAGLSPLLPPETIHTVNIPDGATYLSATVTGNVIDLFYLVELGSKAIPTRLLLLAENETTNREIDGFLLKADLLVGTRFVFQLPP